MARPVAKYPTNHHLSQILERWTANVVYLRGAWSVEAGVSGGREPAGPYDFSNFGSFGDSWSTRLVRRFCGTGSGAPWELSASYASVAETRGDEKERTAPGNAYLRQAGVHGWGTLYGMIEAPRSEPEGDERGYYALFGGSSFWSVTAGVRLFRHSSGPMRRGSYGVLDDMTSNHRPTASTGVGATATTECRASC